MNSNGSAGRCKVFVTFKFLIELLVFLFEIVVSGKMITMVALMVLFLGMVVGDLSVITIVVVVVRMMVVGRALLV